MFCTQIKPPVRLSPLFGLLTQEMSEISSLGSWVNLDFVADVIIREGGPVSAGGCDRFACLSATRGSLDEHKCKMDQSK